MEKQKQQQHGSDNSVETGKGGELQQQASGSHPPLTTNQGVVIADDQNSLRAGPRGPTLLEDFVLREKIMHFDHERIPERVVHARGSAAHGYFELTESLADVSKADIFQRTGEKTPLFVRFSTVAGSKGSPDVPRDVRGFAVKFYTKEGNWDLVGNNMPIFFIQDAIKFPDFVHAAKPEPHWQIPQAATAHDNFWDFISLTPESMHMIMWAMSDRAIPRSLRMMEGFGIHTFRLVNKDGKSTFVKFHWRPQLGMQSVIWDEALKLNGADPDYHRRDLYTSIEMGSFPAWDLCVQLFDQDFADKFEFDVLDPTKIIPEEMLPLRKIGQMVLDRNPDNFFAETEQVAFCTANVVPGIDFSDDPLLQGRNFSYLDTQLKRLGGPNFHQIPINQPRCPMMNFQRDGHMQMAVPKGRVNYEPSMLDADGPRASLKTGYQSFPQPVQGPKTRARSETFADHFSQARQFFFSQTETERNHIVSALTFELSKVETKPVRMRVLSQLANIDEKLCARVAAGLGVQEKVTPAPAAMKTRTDLPESPKLSIIKNAKHILKGRMVGCLVAEGADAALVKSLKEAVTKEGGVFKIIAPKVGGVKTGDGQMMEADFQLAGGPSVLFDVIIVAASEAGGKMLATEAAAVAFVHDAFAHLKFIGHTAGVAELMKKAGVAGHEDKGVMSLSDTGSATKFLEAAKAGRVWDREPKLRTVH
jgi:catalase